MAADALAIVAAAGIAGAAVARLREFWHAFRRTAARCSGSSSCCIVVALAILADVLAPYSPYEQFRDARAAPPVWDEGGSWHFRSAPTRVGRDILSRLIYGARISLFIGLR